MLDNQGLTSTERYRPFQSATHPLAIESDCSANRHIRQMLRVYGLRTSLFRIKVINALVRATQEERVIGVQGVHAYIEASTSELTIISVREVLKRLAEVGVITFQPDRSYRFTLKAWGMLEPHFG
jgi:Fe2+ or Zn2+ uptake regulation protein